MTKKPIITLVILFAAFINVTAQTLPEQSESPLWLRHSAISPDGQTIAFTYKGDIYTVATQGGEARQITTHPAYDTHPVWSPDGTRIAFASAREGSLDIYITSRYGGEPTRLTTNSADETPLTFRDDNHLLFLSYQMPTAQSVIFPTSRFPQVYEVETRSGLRPTLFSPITMEDLSINAQGDMLYHDMKGYEDPFRKHHQSAITRDIWLCRQNQFVKQTQFRGEDRNPVWAADGQSFYYLSEQDGTFNVYRRGINDSNPTQLTHFRGNPVRHLSVSRDQTLCFSYDGEIYTLIPGATPQKVNISITRDRNDTDLIRQRLSSGAREIALSPSGKEIAFIVHGDLFVTSTEYRTTRQITDTPEQERSISFSPDGRSIAYASERGGHWQIYQSTLKKSDEKLFTYATEIEEERLTQTDITSFQPQYSPDGKSIAYIEDRGALRIIDLKTKAVHTAMDGRYNFSYSDGDEWFEWSPDSRWLLSSYIGEGGWHSADVALVSADGKMLHNLTQSGYKDSRARWAMDGKAIIFSSDRAGYRSHGSWGSEYDVYIMFLDLEAYEQFSMNKEEKQLADEQKKAEKEAREKEKEDEKQNPAKKPKADSDSTPKQLVFDLENCRDRVVRLTTNSSHLGDAILSPGGDTLYYQTSFEGGLDLWKREIREGKTQKLLSGISGRMVADKDFKNLYVSSGGIRKVDLGKNSITRIDYEATFNYKPYREREYIFDHIWQQVKDKFYVEDLHGTDWEGYRETYRRFLPHINNEYDFRDMLSEMLGELNGSHTGARYYPSGASLKTACLGLFYDNSYDGDGLRIEEVIRRGPFAVKNTGVTAGCIIEKIDGTPILKGCDYNSLLDGKAGKPVRVTVFNPQTKKRFDVSVKAISNSQQTELLYRRWVDRNRQLVDSLSGGRLAYVHVKAMDSESYRAVYRELLNEKNRKCEAVIVDERHNGGGWLHDDLCNLLNGQLYQKFIAHGKYLADEPFTRWNKPSCVLVCENDYSNGHGFPWAYKTLGIGRLIGTPVAGTMTAVWWETLINGMVFGIPQVGCMGLDGKYHENNELWPDVEVYNTPEDFINGHDTQLERAVNVMLGRE